MDALSDCKSEEQKQECAKELIKEFGDIELLAVLLKQGKKRCMTPAQKALRVLKWSCVFCILIPFLYVGWFFMGKPDVSVNYLAQWNRQVRPDVGDELNAFPLYDEAVKVYSSDAIKAVQSKDIPREERFDESPRSVAKLANEDISVIKQWLDDNTEALDYVQLGNVKPYYWRNYAPSDKDKESTELLSILMPGLGDYKKIAYLLCWQGLLEAEEGKYEEAFESVNNAYVFGDRINGRKNTLIEQLVAMAMKSIANGTLRSILEDYHTDIAMEVLSQLLRDYKNIYANSTKEIDYSGEKLFMYDEAQRCFVKSRLGKDHLYLPRLEMLGGDKIISYSFLRAKGVKMVFAHPDKEETLKTVDNYHELMQRYSKKTPATRKAEGNPINKMVEELCEDNVFLGIMLPALGGLIDLSYNQRIDSEATMLIMQLLKYQKQHLEFPEALEELLTADMIDEIPVDPFSDKSLVYKRTRDSFLLYSVGRDFIDDGGVRKSKKNIGNKDIVYWPIDD